MTTAFLPLTRCPSCDKKLDAVTKVGRSTRMVPNEDFTICSYCAAWLRFEADMSLREVTQEDLKELTENQIKVMKDVSMNIMEMRSHM